MILFNIEVFFLSLATLPNASSAYSQSTKGEEEKEEDVDEDSQFMRLAKKYTNKSLQKKGILLSPFMNGGVYTLRRKDYILLLLFFFKLAVF